MVTGIVGGLVGAVQSLAGLIGGLFSLGRNDTAAVDQARVAAENAIVEKMGESVQFVDQVQRAGGAFMGYETFRFDNGEETPHTVPLSEPVPLAAGTSWIPPHTPLTHSAGYRYPGALATEQLATRSTLAGGTGQLELLESGLWIIDFQVSVLQGGAYTSQPVDVWCHVTPADAPWLPIGPPGVTPAGNPRPGEQSTLHRETGALYYQPESIVAAYGRASGYVGTRNSPFTGGNSIAGTVLAVLPSAGWKVTLSCNSWEKAGGAMSTYVYATKINSTNLQQQIDELRETFATALPGNPVPLQLDDASIQAMVAEAEAIDVLNEEPPA